MGLFNTATQLLSSPSRGVQLPNRALNFEDKQKIVYDLLKRFATMVQSGVAIGEAGRNLLSQLNEVGLGVDDVRIAMSSLKPTKTRDTLVRALSEGVPNFLPPAPQPAAAPIGPPPPAAAPVSAKSGLYDGDILLELVRSDRSWLVTGATGTGKSTTVAARAALQLAQNNQTQFYYVDLQAERFIGLERDISVTTQLNGIGSEVIAPFANVVARVYEALKARNNADQKAVREGKPKQQHHPLILVINEFNGICNIGDDMPLAEQRECGFPTAMQQIKAIIQRGRSLNVFCWLIAQTHRKTEIGLAPGVLKSMDIFGCGIRRGCNGDYDSIKFLLDDNYILPKDDKARLSAVLPQALKVSMAQKQAIALSTQGESKLALLRPDVLEWAAEDASGYYRYGMTGLYGGHR